MPEKEVPESVRGILAAMARRAVARCYRLGIAEGDFLRAMAAERRLHPEISVSELFSLTFRRLSAGAN